jgi:hypothetical protein
MSAFLSLPISEAHLACPRNEMPQWTHHRARLAALSRDRGADDPDLLDARRDLRAARLEEYIRRTVDASPALTDAQRDRLAVLLQRPPAGQRPDDGLTPGQPPRTDPRRGRVAEQTLEPQL